MKLILFTVIVFVGRGLTAPTAHENDIDTAMSNIFSRTAATKCDECKEHRDNCLKYGNGDNNSGEDKVCNSFICRKFNCRSCGDEFSCDNANLTMPPGW
ncbi:hypothetical protein PMIN06_005806 [Paraphaeosphaeria minitans]|uniref:Uncharacterized protein n=1 Tax=Paraphaeosphaeria minitans TaxID=565426 RepID=A0A9P6G962_9PLEO|nr:hypothetical protein PMIN01_10879 [Paraphaeosphaeria minitans]